MRRDHCNLVSAEYIPSEGNRNYLRTLTTRYSIVTVMVRLPGGTIMKFIYRNSLSETLNAINAAFFFQQKIPAADREAAAAFIASRHGQPRAYANTFALFPDELKNGIRLFTGEHAVCASRSEAHTS